MLVEGVVNHMPTLQCGHCEEDYDLPPSKAKRSEYCSKDCKHAAQSNKVRLTCQQCGDGFDAAYSKRDRKYCGRACYGESRRKPELRECPDCGGEKTPSSDRCQDCHYEQYWEERGGRPTCQTCGEELNPSDGDKSRPKYCSRECYFETKRETRECPICGTDFKTSRASDQKTCGDDSCVSEIMSRSKRVREERECPRCGDTFEVRPSDPHKYCSRECFKVPRVSLVCAWCGEDYERRETEAEESRYCSNDCRQQGTFRNLGKRRKASCGHHVLSEAERQICEWFNDHEMFHRYEPEGPAGMADWYVNGTYVEYWGGKSLDGYAENRERKEAAYEDSDADVLHLEESDLDCLDKALKPLTDK